jgi:hypothetical protein
MMRAALAIIFTLIAPPSFCCDSLSDVHNAGCAQWAPLSGDVSDDACTIAMLNVLTAKEDIADLDTPHKKGDPIWTRAYLNKIFVAASEKQVAACKGVVMTGEQ